MTHDNTGISALLVVILVVFNNFFCFSMMNLVVCHPYPSHHEDETKGLLHIAHCVTTDSDRYKQLKTT
jgi:hypothetical protein